MRNILSYQPGTIFSGKEINDWIKFHSENKTSHYKDAVRLFRYIFKDNRNYELCYLSIHEGQKAEPSFFRVQAFQKGKKGR